MLLKWKWEICKECFYWSATTGSLFSLINLWKSSHDGGRFFIYEIIFLRWLIFLSCTCEIAAIVSIVKSNWLIFESLAPHHKLRHIDFTVMSQWLIFHITWWQCWKLKLHLGHSFSLIESHLDSAIRIRFDGINIIFIRYYRQKAQK